MNTENERNEIPDSFRDHWEWQRLRAWELHEEGWTQARIAEALGVTAGAVSQWFKPVRTDADLAHLEVCLKRTAFAETYGHNPAYGT